MAIHFQEKPFTRCKVTPQGRAIHPLVAPPYAKECPEGPLQASGSRLRAIQRPCHQPKGQRAPRGPQKGLKQGPGKGNGIAKAIHQ